MSDSVLRKLSFEEIHSQRPDIKKLSKIDRHPVVVLLDDIRSLHNVGAVFRTADGIHLEHIYLCGITGTPPRTEIRKTSLGAEEAVPWTYINDAAGVIEQLKKDGYQIVVLEHTNDSKDFRKADYKFPLCLIVGNEFHGVKDELVPMADLAIEIPMFGIKQSFNVSVAFGIAAYEILSHWEQNNK